MLKLGCLDLTRAFVVAVALPPTEVGDEWTLDERADPLGIRFGST